MAIDKLNPKPVVSALQGVDQTPVQPPAWKKFEAPDCVTRTGQDPTGAPRANQPLDGAFSGQRVTVPMRRQPEEVWRGPVVDAASLGEQSERDILRQAGRDCVLAAYGGFDPNKPPVVLVHGINGSAEDLADMATRLQSEGKQVLVAFYYDRRRATHESGQALAQELHALRTAHYPIGTNLDIVAHSMGGIVSRAALNELQNPNWIPSWLNGASDATVSTTASDFRAGFGDIRLRSVDTPWEGFAHEPEIPILGPIIRAVTRFFMKIFGWLGAFDMRGNSQMFQHLYEPKLEGVSIENHAASQNPADGIRSLPDLEEDELNEVLSFVLNGTTPTAHRARNMANSLRQDARYGQLRTQLRRELDEARDPSDRRAALIRAYATAMPRFPGSHTSVLRDHADGDDVVDHVSRDLR